MEKNQLSVIKKDFVRNLLSQGKREDGRNLEQFRDLRIEVDYVPTRAQGSAMVHLGNTKVIAGVKCQVEKPYPDTPDRGNFMTSAEFCIMASPYFEAGPPGIEAIEVARVTDRSLRESGVIDMEALCITPGEKVWAVFVDMEIIDYDGNLFDACSIAALAAVLSARLPADDPKSGETIYKKDKPLPLKEENATFSVTFAKIGEHILADPGLYEELIADCRVTIGTDPKGNVRAMQKGGFGSFTVDEVKELRRKAYEIGRDTYDQIKSAVARK